MTLNIHSTSPSDSNPEGGLKTLAEIERLQNYVLQELQDLDSRIRDVFKLHGYRETESMEFEDPLISSE